MRWEKNLPRPWGGCCHAGLVRQSETPAEIGKIRCVHARIFSCSTWRNLLCARSVFVRKCACQHPVLPILKSNKCAQPKTNTLLNKSSISGTLLCRMSEKKCTFSSGVKLITWRCSACTVGGSSSPSLLTNVETPEAVVPGREIVNSEPTWRRSICDS